MSWRERALCSSVTHVDWFPEWDKHGGATAKWKANLAAAKLVCAECPVAPQCLATALEDPHTAGIWAGTTESERRGRWQRPRVIRCGTDSGYTRHIRDGEDACTACKEAHAYAWRLRRMAVAR